MKQLEQPGSILPPRKMAGVSLIEMGMVIVFISLALAPIIKVVGGPQNESGNAFRVNSVKSREAILANTMVDKVLAHDYSAFNCNSTGVPDPSFDPATQLPVGTTSTNSIKKFNICQAQNSSATLYYQWTVVHLNSTNNGDNMPSKNRYYQATFNVLGQDKDTNNPLLTIPVNFFYNEGGTDSQNENTGVMVAMDRSGSMAWSDQANNLPSMWGVTSPFLFYRYKAFPTSVNEWGFTNPANPPAKEVLDSSDNTQ
jgi:hypothetical protein